MMILKYLIKRARMALQPDEVTLLEEACSMGFPFKMVVASSGSDLVSPRTWVNLMVQRPPYRMTSTGRIMRLSGGEDLVSLSLMGPELGAGAPAA